MEEPQGVPVAGDALTEPAPMEEKDPMPPTPAGGWVKRLAITKTEPR